MEPSQKKRKFSKPLCPHCGVYVSKSTFYRHYRDFYDKSTGSWVRNLESDKSTEFQFSSGSANESAGDATEEVRDNGYEHEADIEEVSIMFISRFWYHRAFLQESPLTFVETRPEMECLEVWESDSENESEVSRQNESTSSHTKLINFVCVFLLAWHTIFRIPNAAIGVLFRFISLFLLKLSELTGSELIQKMYELFPDSLERAHLMQDVDANRFKKFVVCPKCHTVYDHSDLMGTGISTCSFVSFPRHPQHRMRKKCNTALFKSVRTASGKRTFPPKKVFCYQSIIGFLRGLVKKPQMFK